MHNNKVFPGIYSSFFFKTRGQGLRADTYLLMMGWGNVPALGGCLTGGVSAPGGCLLPNDVWQNVNNKMPNVPNFFKEADHLLSSHH